VGRQRQAGHYDSDHGRPETAIRAGDTDGDPKTDCRPELCSIPPDSLFPEVSISYSDNGLFADRESGTRIRVNGFIPSSPKDSIVRFDQVGPGYFSAVGIPMLLGRDFTDTDTANALRVTVINESVAKFYFGKRSPLGETIFYDSRLKFTLTVIGVAKDVRDHLVRDQPPRRFYFSYMQPVDGQMGTTTKYEAHSLRRFSTARSARRCVQSLRVSAWNLFSRSKVH
jgi:MacB-like periplasmic core domain